MRFRAAISVSLTACLVTAAAVVALTGPPALAQVADQAPDDSAAVQDAVQAVKEAQERVDIARGRLNRAYDSAGPLQTEHTAVVKELARLERERHDDQPSPAIKETRDRLAGMRDRLRAADQELAELTAAYHELQDELRAANERLNKARLDALGERDNERWAEVEQASEALKAAVDALGAGDVGDPAARAAVAAATDELTRAMAAHGAALDLHRQELRRRSADLSTLDDEQSSELAKSIDWLRDTVERYAQLRLDQHHFEGQAELRRHREQRTRDQTREARGLGTEAEGAGHDLTRSSEGTAALVAADTAARRARRELLELTAELGLDAPADAHDLAAITAHDAATAAMAAAEAAAEVFGELVDPDAGMDMTELATLTKHWQEQAEELLAVEHFHRTQSEAARLRADAAAGDDVALWELTRFLERWTAQLNEAAELAEDPTLGQGAPADEDVLTDRLVRLEAQLAVVEAQYEAARGTPGALAPGLPDEVRTALAAIGDGDAGQADARFDVLLDAYVTQSALRDQRTVQEADQRELIDSLRHNMAAETAKGGDADQLRLERQAELLAGAQEPLARLRRDTLTFSEQAGEIGRLIEGAAAEIAKAAGQLWQEAQDAAGSLGAGSSAAARRKVAEQTVAAAEAARRARAAAERVAAANPEDGVLRGRLRAIERVAEEAARAADERVSDAKAVERRDRVALDLRVKAGDQAAIKELLAEQQRRREKTAQLGSLDPAVRRDLERRLASLDRHITTLTDQLGDAGADQRPDQQEGQQEGQQAEQPGEQPRAAPAPGEPPAPAQRPADGGDGDRRTPEANATADERPPAQPHADPEGEPGEVTEQPGGLVPIVAGGLAPGRDSGLPVQKPAEVAQKDQERWVPTVEPGHEVGEGAAGAGGASGAVGGSVQGSQADIPPSCGPKGTAAICAHDQPAPGGGDPCSDQGGASGVMATCRPDAKLDDGGVILDPLPPELPGERQIFDPLPDDDLIGRPDILLPADDRAKGPASCGLTGNVLAICKEDVIDLFGVVTMPSYDIGTGWP